VPVYFTTNNSGDRLLDLFLTNKSSLVKNMATIPGISDHNIILADCGVTAEIPKGNPRKVHLFTKANWEAIRAAATKFQQAYMSNHNHRSVTDNYTCIKAFITDTVNEHVPSKNIGTKYMSTMAKHHHQANVSEETKAIQKGEEVQPKQRLGDVQNLQVFRPEDDQAHQE